MVSITPLTRILFLVAVVSIGFGYLKAYTGPFLGVTLTKVGYGMEQIARIQTILAALLTVGSWAATAAIAIVSYHDGTEYKLTMSSAVALIILAYLAEVVGNFLGAVICQIQIPEYPIIQFSISEIVTSYTYVYICLIGVLAANYVRELARKKT